MYRADFTVSLSAMACFLENYSTLRKEKRAITPIDPYQAFIQFRQEALTGLDAICMCYWEPVQDYIQNQVNAEELARVGTMEIFGKAAARSKEFDSLGELTSFLVMQSTLYIYRIIMERAVIDKANNEQQIKVARNELKNGIVYQLNPANETSNEV